MTFYLNKVNPLGIGLLWLSLTSPLQAAELGWPGYDLAGIPCTGTHQPYGPFNYDNADHRANRLPIVEQYHFTTQIEAGAGIDANVAADIDYTIRAFPNHHRALYAMVRHQLRFKRPFDTKRYSSMECYFQRALAFAPRDLKVYQLYAYYLDKLGEYEVAAEQYKRALQVSDQPRLHYRLGETYLKLKDYAKAVEHAQAALAGGYQKPELKRALQAAGQWSDA